MPGGGGDGDVLRSPAPARGGRQQRHPRWLPLDVVVAIAARSDPATHLRCAATCRGARRRVADDPGFLARLRLRGTDRFVLPLLRGHLTTGPTGCNDRLSMLDTTAADNTRFVRNVHYVLLVGDGESGGASNAVGRPFRVLKTNLVLTKHNSPLRRLQIQIFSSDLSAWGPLTEIPTPNLHGRGSSRQAKPLVVGDVVHWLCLTHTGSYVLMLRVGAARVTVTTLPASFPRAPAVPHAGSSSNIQHYSYLLATTSAGGSPVVLVGDDKRILAWSQSTHSKIWKQRPWVVIEKEAILRFDDKVGERLDRSARTTAQIELESFAERNGAVLIRISKCGFFWLDLQSKKIVRRFPNPRSERTKVPFSYEMCLSSWVPTFSSSGTL
ncbi:hypothetical protein C2845_PM03G15440 [Panicum miliaceum]|uniref:DUF7595 domain-containing protein n=1 Tax=Panicum miliaceum TaxID=4540 RepID=A0A3L6T8J7_PANMI|nr:hypothetical protein C2845_PM03G15440 [Panicum miliaceum]